MAVVKRQKLRLVDAGVDGYRTPDFRFHLQRGDWDEEQLGSTWRVLERHADGSMVVLFEVVGFAAARAWLLGHVKSLGLDYNADPGVSN